MGAAATHRQFDVIVVGAGHNGLTAAAYLARAGRRVLVLERRAVVGGCAVTEEIDPLRAPGCRVSTASYIASMLRPEVISDLRLGNYGLRMEPCEPGVQVAFEDGSVLAWWSDRGRLVRELEAVSPGDVAGFIALEQELKHLAGYLEPLFLQAPPDFAASGVARWRDWLQLWWRLRALRGRDLAPLTRFMTTSLAQLLESQFAHPKLQRLVLANSLYGKHGGPWQPGTAMGLLFHLLSGGERRQAGFQGHVMGGMGSITAALASACRDLGVEIRCDSEVASIDVHDHAVRGVTLQCGQSLAAGVVLSNADPKRTYLGLLDARWFEPQFLNSVRAIRMAGPCGKVNYVLSAEPRVTGMPADRTPAERSLFTLVPTLADAEAGYHASQRGKIHDRLWIDCVLASNVDSSLVTADRHVMTCFVQFLPWQPSDGDWPSRRDALGDQVTRQIENYAPGFSSTVVARDVLTPFDLEQRFGITEGNIFHGDIALDQLWHMRPVPQYSRYRGPLRGLYLCSAGGHPGGGVTGAPGYNAARQLLRDGALGAA
ncbi:MAG: NAD(P)/FAD-dependent oxidoreductase [Steroidobacteraceae bacterium]